MADGDLGVVLKTTPLRESDLLVVLYTATQGRVTAVARGARKSPRCTPRWMAPRSWPSKGGRPVSKQ